MAAATGERDVGRAGTPLQRSTGWSAGWCAPERRISSCLTFVLESASICRQVDFSEHQASPECRTPRPRAAVHEKP